MRSDCVMVCKGHPCPLSLYKNQACWPVPICMELTYLERPVKPFVKIVSKEPVEGVGQSALMAEQGQLSSTGALLLLQAASSQGSQRQHLRVQKLYLIERNPQDLQLSQQVLLSSWVPTSSLPCHPEVKSISICWEIVGS